MSSTIRFNNVKYCNPSTDCISAIFTNLINNSDYFRIQYQSMVFTAEKGRVFCTVRTESLNIIQVGLRLCGLSVLTAGHYGRNLEMHRGHQPNVPHQI
jgi:hypothetical protein